MNTAKENRRPFPNPRGIAKCWFAAAAQPVLVCCGLTLCAAENEPAEARATADRMLIAVERKDYEGFIAEADGVFKTALNPAMLEAVCKIFCPRMEKGYALTYLGELDQQGCRVILWKAEFKDGGDDVLVKLVLKNGKAARFWLQ